MDNAEPVAGEQRRRDKPVLDGTQAEVEPAAPEHETEPDAPDDGSSSGLIWRRSRRGAGRDAARAFATGQAVVKPVSKKRPWEAMWARGFSDKEEVCVY